MATIRDVVQALGQFAGVETVVVLGRDGLTIDSLSHNGSDPEGVAALVPSLVEACGRLGEAGTRGEFSAGVMEYGDGFVVVSVVTVDALIAVVVKSNTNLGGLMYELRRYRAAFADLL
jgi:predicted regulator of Ras-like GTPase activity (Roadblock/LC7/MglB family)